MTGQPLAPQDSIDGVTDRLREWISLREPGLVWTRYASDLSRNQVLDRLTAEMPLARFVFEPPDSDQAGPWLQEALTAMRFPDSVQPVVAVLCPFEPFGTKRERLIDAFRSINLRREPIARLPIIQLWWIPQPLAAAIELAMPDLLSWCKLRLWLNQLPDAVTADEVERYRQLASGNPAEFLPKLSGSLNELSNTLRDLGRWEDALRIVEEEVELNRQLAQQRPDAFLPKLAGSLNNLANRLSDLGRREEALARAEEAVGIYRQLAQQRPDAFLPDLGASLNNLANRLSDLGRREEAQAQAEEAVGIYRRLAQQRPDAFLPDLGASLNNLATMLSDLGRREEALARAEEAVAIRRQLAQQRPDAFLPDLATSLTVSANIKREQCPADAIPLLAEAIRILIPFLSRAPQAFAPLAQTVVGLYLRVSQTAQVEPDLGLLAPLLEIFEKIKPVQGGSGTQPAP